MNCQYGFYVKNKWKQEGHNGPKSLTWVRMLVLWSSRQVNKMDENVNNIRSVSTYDNKMYLDKIYMWNLIFGERSVFYAIKY